MRLPVAAFVLVSLATQQAPPAPVPVTRLQTRWAAQVTTDRVLPEYPRPQLARKNRTTHLVPASDRESHVWRYTTTAPAANRFETAFDDQAWQSGPAGFGARDTRFANVGTEWKTADIWLRRTVDLPATAPAAK